MKKALRLIFMYLLFLMFGVSLASVIYSFFQNVLHFVAGRKIELFEWKNFILSVIFITQSILFMICPLMAYYRIRHTGGFVSLVTYIILCFITWIILFPLTLQLNKKIVPKIKGEIVEQPLSGGYFRRVDDKIFYSIKDLPASDAESDSVSMLVIDTSADNGITESLEGNDSVLYEKALPFRDVLIKDNFLLKDNKSTISFRFLISKAESAWEKGFTHWMGFLSLGFLLSSIYGLVSFFAWRLVNAVFCFFITFAAIVLNSFYFSPVLETFRNMDFMKNTFFNFLGKYIDEPFLCIVNIFFGLLFIAVGIIKFVVAKKGKEA